MKFVTGIIYGAFIWVVMNLLVLPVSNIQTGTFNFANAIIGMTILIICIGMPLAFIASKQIDSEK